MCKGFNLEVNFKTVRDHKNINEDEKHENKNENCSSINPISDEFFHFIGNLMLGVWTTFNQEQEVISKSNNN